MSDCREAAATLLCVSLTNSNSPTHPHTHCMTAPHPTMPCRFAGGPTGYPGPTTPCVETNVSVPELSDELSFYNPQRVYSGGWGGVQVG